MSAGLRDRYASGLRAVAGTFWSDQLGTWQGLWEVASGHLGAARWASRAARTWSRWASPSAWIEPFLPAPDEPPASGPPIVRFVVDRVAEATPEQQVVLRIRPDTAVTATPLRHILGHRSLPASSVVASLAGSGSVLRVGLIDLFAIQAKIRQGALSRGHYVGAVLAGDPPAPIALVDVCMEG